MNPTTTTTASNHLQSNHPPSPLDLNGNSTNSVVPQNDKPSIQLNFPSISPKQLVQTLQLNPDSTLVLDIRPQASFIQSHLKHSINFNLPTTLLRRPLYGADKIQSSLQSSEQRERFDRYKTALPLSNIPTDSKLRLNQILVLDHQTSSPNQIHPLTLVLNKFANIGFQGRLVWLNGGFQALLKLITDRPDWSEQFLDSDQPLHPHLNSTPDKSNPLGMSFSIPPLPPTALLPSASLPTPPAPSNQITKSSQPSHPPKPRTTSRRIQMSLGMLLPQTPSSESSPFHFISNSTSRPYHHSLSISRPSASQSSLSTSPPPNPFFDNIRQLNERLSLSGSLQHLTPIDLPILSNPNRDLPRMPQFLSRLIQDSPRSRAQRLAHEFHDLEMAEQLRLQDVMRWESSRGYLITSTKIDSSSNSLTDPSSQALTTDHRQSRPYHGCDLPNHHPFSISAGVELGYKNRYKNIWPYEHARIRLRGGTGRRIDSDYVNASMINFRSDGAPPGLDLSKVGRKRYIATQGPLTSTFEDFWSVVAEEDVGLIIMITRKREAGREKCADYVRNGQYGENVVSVNQRRDQNDGIESDSDEERDQATGFFGFTDARITNHNDQQIERDQSSTHKNNKPAAPDGTKGGILCKTIHLSRATRPDLPPRQIAHIQYRGWPDFDVPPAAEEVLELIARSRRASEETVRLNDEAIDEYLQTTSSSKTSSTKVEDRSEIERIVGRGLGPVIVHCSAGVGRTGSFILLDIMVDVLKAQYLSASTSTTQTNIDLGSTDLIQSISKIPPSEPSDTTRHLHQASNLTSSSLSNPGHDANKTPCVTALPRFLNSQLCDCQAEIAPIWQRFPIMPVVNEMREQRMSMVANYQQYVFLHEVLMKFMINELNIPTTKSTPQHSEIIGVHEVDGKSSSNLVLPVLGPPTDIYAVNFPPQSIIEENNEQNA